jgi:hypothetical protein
MRASAVPIQCTCRDQDGQENLKQAITVIRSITHKRKRGPPKACIIAVISTLCCKNAPRILRSLTKKCNGHQEGAEDGRDEPKLWFGPIAPLRFMRLHELFVAPSPNWISGDA